MILLAETPFRVSHFPPRLYSYKLKIVPFLRYLHTIPSLSLHPMLQGLPFDVLFEIMKYLEVIDIVRMRLVSKKFHCWEVTRDRGLWSALYRTSRLPRPPGPFSWQSIELLEDNLVTSATVARNLSPNCTARPVSSRIINIGSGNRDHAIGLVAGRWLLASDYSRIRCFDLDHADSESTVVYNTEHTYFGCFSGYGVTGHSMSFVVTATNGTCGHTGGSINVFKLGDGSQPALLGHLVSIVPLRYHANQIKVVLGPRLLAIYPTESQDLHAQVIIMDTQTYHLYQLPSNVSDRQVRAILLYQKCGFELILGLLARS
ncbi:hypothetical protein BV22DRAFT_760453 [Leucogyrophana mollusca]|uniref:Uncharacterized protein n=1 Tax=Leucogyrophana mollusca TaxID=85980 RepID=A0ACB8B5L1_9AGAM|nr:hypothetical protein BV22DRAFT_760453 [Leucogyrophana mollusca]